jgi:hypothetical protein
MNRQLLMYAAILSAANLSLRLMNYANSLMAAAEPK